jgi:hypothetical protein
MCDMSKLSENRAKITQILADIEQLPEDRYEIGLQEGREKIKAIIDRSVTEITAEDLQGATSIGAGAFYECKKLTYVNIPDGVKTIGERAFWYCTSLPSIEIPEGVKSIGNQAFYYCSSLESANIPESVTSIGTTAFQGCSSLVSVNIPTGIKEIVSNVFTNCSSLPSIEIPASVTSIGYYAFGGCTSLKNVILKSATPPTMNNSNSFSQVPSDCVFIVPYGCGEAYKAATNWSKYSDQIVEGDV